MMKTHLDNQPPTDVVFEALATQHRRQVLCFLATSGGDTVSRDEVAEHIAATTDPSVEAVQTNLHHKDLPKLERAGFVEYDERDRAIRSRNTELISKLRKLGLLDCTPQFGP